MPVEHSAPLFTPGKQGIIKKFLNFMINLCMFSNKKKTIINATLFQQ
jgi:hypothetical protein